MSGRTHGNRRITDEQVAEINRQGKDFTPPGGESFSDVGERVYEWATYTLR